MASAESHCHIHRVEMVFLAIQLLWNNQLLSARSSCNLCCGFFYCIPGISEHNTVWSWVEIQPTSVDTEHKLLLMHSWSLILQGVPDSTRRTCCPLLGYIFQLNKIYMGTAIWRIWSDLRIRVMTYTFFNQKFENGVNKGLNWFGFNQMVSFKDITQNRFSKMAKISHSAELEIC